MLGARASKPAKTSPRTMTVLLWTVVAVPMPSLFWLRLRTRCSPLQIDRHALPLRITVEHAFERILAAHAALLISAVGLTRKLSEALIDLNPAGLDRMRRIDCLADVTRPHVRRETIMAVVRHADRFALVFPRNGHHHRAEDLLSRNAPVVAHVGKHRWLDEIAACQRSFFRRQSAEREPCPFLLNPVGDVAADAIELLPVDDGSHVGRFIGRIADRELLERRRQLREERVKDRTMQEEPRSRGA